MEDYEQQAYEEGRYWFCLSDVVDYMEINGPEMVFKDLTELFAQRQNINNARKQKIDLEDIPF